MTISLKCHKISGQKPYIHRFCAKPQHSMHHDAALWRHVENKSNSVNHWWLYYIDTKFAGVRQKFMGESCTTFGKVLTLLLIVAASAVQCSDMDKSSWFMLSQCCWHPFTTSVYVGRCLGTHQSTLTLVLEKDVSYSGCQTENDINQLLTLTVVVPCQTASYKCSPLLRVRS